MALFQAAALLDDSPESKTITCDFFAVPDGVEYPTITLKVTNKLREVYRQADDKYRFSNRYVFKKGHNRPVGYLVNNPIQFCFEILNEGYESSEGLIDTPSKKVVLALIRREVAFSKKLASKLVDLFESDDLYQEAEDDEKN